MPGFARERTVLTCDGVSLTAIGRDAGTPTYVYSAAAIRAAYEAFDRAFGAHPHTIHYALKANSTLAIVRLLGALGSHVDANSGGELDLAHGLLRQRHGQNLGFLRGICDRRGVDRVRGAEDAAVDDRDVAAMGFDVPDHTGHQSDGHGESILDVVQE